MNARRILLLCLACVCALSHAQTSTLPLSEQQARSAGIAYARVAPASVPADGIRLSGTAQFPVKALEVVSTPAAGVVQEVLVNPMETLAANAPLARLYSPQLLEWQRDYVQMSAREKLAAEKLARDEALYREGIIAMSRLQETRSALVEARVAARERAQLLKLAGMDEAGMRALAQGASISPVLSVKTRSAGTVLELPAQPGQRVEAGAPLAKLGHPGALALELQATRSQAEGIAPGDEVTVAGCGKAGKVSAVSPQMEAASQSVLVRAELPGADKCLRPNQYLDATVRAKSAPAGSVTLPSAALARQGERDIVYKREGAGVRAVPVTVILRGPEHSLARGALAAGDEVVVAGQAALKGMALGMGAQEGGK